MKRFLLIVKILTISLLGFSQQSELRVSDYLLPTPSSAVFRQYMGEQSDLSTGAVRLDVPFYEIAFKEFHLPIALKYLSNGIRVFDSPYPCGYGWSLHPGLRVTRTIIGRPDESFPRAEESRDGLGDYEYARMCVIDECNLLHVEGRLDPGRDIFFVHLPQKDCVCLIEPSSNGYDLVGPDDELKITTDAALTCITAIDSDGIKYIFNSQPEYVAYVTAPPLGCFLKLSCLLVKR